MKENKKSKIILKVLAIILVVVVIGLIVFGIGVVVKHNIEYKEYCQRKYKIGIGTTLNDNSEYLEKVEMDYVEQDGIKMKVDSILMTDDNFKANIKMLFNEDIDFNVKNPYFSYAIYDDEKNVYEYSTNMSKMLPISNEGAKYIKNFCKDIGVKYDFFGNRLGMSNGGGTSIIDLETVQLEAIGIKDSFPRSKKIYIRIFDLGYIDIKKSNEETTDIFEDFVQISDAEWIFEIDIPEKFYNRQTIYLKPAEEISGIEFSKLELTETALTVVGKWSELTELWREGKDVDGEEYEEWSQKRDNILYITNGEGNRYDSVRGGSGEEKDSFTSRFLANKEDLNKKLYLNYTINGVLKTVELVQK